jgi:predicted permease
MTDVRQSAFYEQALQQIGKIPGVESAGAISNLFMNSSPDTTIFVEGRSSGADGGQQVIDDVITPGFFRTVETPLKQGRLFSEYDGRTAKHVAIINSTFAKRFWPNQNSVGKRFQFGDGRFSDPWVTVVGVIENMRRNGLENQPIAQVFLPMAQLPSRGTDFVIRSAANPQALATNVRREMAKVDRSIPVYRLSTLDKQIAETIAPRKFQTFLFGVFAFASVLLAAIGVYGLAHYTVLQRMPEFGVRMALGATSLEIVQLVVEQNLRLTIIGLSLGICSSLLAMRAIKGLLFDVSTTDPLTFVLAPICLMLVMLIACTRPAWQATRIDPVTTLRYE